MIKQIILLLALISSVHLSVIPLDGLVPFRRAVQVCVPYSRFYVDNTICICDADGLGADCTSPNQYN
ncbi:unnamed protein product, partial [Brenthis ino]